MTPSKKQAEAPQPATPAVQPQPAPAPAPRPAVAAAAAQPPAPTKQELTLMKLSVELAKRNVTVKPEMLSKDGKFLVLNIGAEWPEIRIGNGGGIDLPAIKSYPNAFAAAVEADKLLAKQNARAQKPATPTAPVAVTVTSHVVPEEKKEVAPTPAQKKQKAHEAIEARLQA
jgi:hypothetical protein